MSSIIINISDNKKAGFALVTILFLMWGSIVSLNDILIPHFKSIFTMNYTETMLVQFSFFGAYFLVSFPANLIVEKIGYQKGIIVGLLITSIGSLLFIPASWLISYPLFLVGLFAMAAVGGAIFPVLQGVLADSNFVGLHYSYILPLSCYIFVLYYGLSGFRPIGDHLYELKTESKKLLN